MKRVLSIACITALMLSLCIVPAAAAEMPVLVEDVVYFEDGSFLTTELIVNYDDVAATRATYRISGQKNVEYSNASGEVMWTMTVYGTFTYDGTSATAISASYSYDIYNDSWSFRSGEAYCSDNQAIAEGTFNGGLLLNRSVTVTLTCSAKGVLS